jgi:hypothetical protein
MKFETDLPPENKQKEKGPDYKTFINAEIRDNFSVLNNQFLIKKLGGIERSINKSLIPALFNSPESASAGINCIVDYFTKNNISTEQQLQFLKGIQLSLNDIQLLAEDKNATYEYVQFAYQWAGLARDKWNLSQEAIQLILSQTIDSLDKERNRDDISYLTFLYLDPENMLSRKPKIERFMQNMEPNLIDEANHIYHFNSNGEDPLFLKLDTEEKRKKVRDFLAEVRKGWDKMFKKYPTVKMYTHYELPEEFEQFILSEKQVRDYFPHIAFNKDGEILRENMKNMLNPNIRDALYRDINIDLTQLQKEQAYLIEYISNKKRGEILPLKNFINNYGKEGLKSFISCAHSEEMGDKILELGDSEKLPKEVAEKVFAKYGEYIDAVDTVEEMIKKEYKFPPSSELIDKTKESLLTRGRDLLLTQNEKLSQKKFSEKEFIQSLENISVDVDLFKNIFRIVKENNPETSFEDFAGLVPEQVTTREDIDDLDISEIKRIIEKNYSNEELRKAVFESFEKAINSKNSTLNLLRRDEKVIALDRMDRREDGSLYFGSFNVDPDYCSSKIGAAFFEATVLPLMKEKVVRADCSSLQPIASYYIESGFIANSMYDYNGEPSLSLESNPQKNFSSKDLSKSKIIEMSSNVEDSTNVIINSFTSQEEVVRKGIPDGYALARYFFDRKSNKWFTVLEKSN